MAITKKEAVYGIEINSYIKIVSFQVNETEADEEGKTYQAIISLAHYTNETKEFCFLTETVVLEKLRIYELSIESFYDKLGGKKV